MRNNFMPQSKYYGDKHPRTMEEAFGPGAELDPPFDDGDGLVWLIMGAFIGAGVTCVVGWAFWIVVLA